MAQLHGGDTHLYFWYWLGYVPIFFVVSEIQGSKLQKLSKKYKFSYFLGPPCRNPLADLKHFAPKRAPAYPLSVGLHLMTLRQKQKVAVLFTKMSTLTPKNVQPPPLGPPSTERPQKRRMYIPCEFGVDRPTRFRDMDYAIFPH